MLLTQLKMNMKSHPIFGTMTRRGGEVKSLIRLLENFGRLCSLEKNTWGESYSKIFKNQDDLERVYLQLDDFFKKSAKHYATHLDS